MYLAAEAASKIHCQGERRNRQTDATEQTKAGRGQEVRARYIYVSLPTIVRLSIPMLSVCKSHIIRGVCVWPRVYCVGLPEFVPLSRDAKTTFAQFKMRWRMRRPPHKLTRRKSITALAKPRRLPMKNARKSVQRCQLESRFFSHCLSSALNMCLFLLFEIYHDVSLFRSFLLLLSDSLIFVRVSYSFTLTSRARCVSHRPQGAVARPRRRTQTGRGSAAIERQLGSQRTFVHACKLWSAELDFGCMQFHLVSVTMRT